MNRRTLLAGAAAATVATALGTVPRPTLAQNPFWSGQWPRTDFAKHSVDLSEIRSGGVPKDGIPALLAVTHGDAAGLDPREGVLTLAVKDGPEVAYPLRYLMWHEIANDVVAGVPVAVTYCPLCNSGLIFDRRVAGQTLTFGVTGNLRFSDMVMYDHQTESWWQQFTGEAIVGEMTGTFLTPLVAWMEPVSAFVARNPEGAVMQEPQGARRPYGRNPYVGYDLSSRPFLYDGEDPPHGIPALMRVVRVGDRAWPLSRFEDRAVIEEAGIRLEWRGTMASALDGPTLASGRDIGAIRVVDTENGADLVHEVVFAFAFHAFEPDGIWMLDGR